MKNIIAIKNLTEFYKKHPDSKSSIEIWAALTKNSIWEKPLDVVRDFPGADQVKNNRVVFNIARNKYRLIVQISYLRQWVFIKSIGTHSEYDYDKVGANTVEQF
ncbi:type II toxin-antitoxin system HigB family toxin [Algoriphagus sp. AGSA1]|uniref:type II toxin-antitoxin system HigB family toxin n=1 Tax=Algoriphagus sp. AGSA1 TaxID=2907213 RepID=UPI001F42A1F9|nr:type II toxin-antitoxin system HigB family toxin [Algoriphagus sp. AGSA1]MCE7054999.1 type II toxin-antitoxin system HigB family toxin [Algoriphagus sp. AGSA1]